MENQSISSTTNSSSTLLHSRDAVLKYIKQSLQVFYDAGTITRVQYVDICKSILYKTMNSSYGSPNWTPQVLMQEIAQRVSECAANGADGVHHHHQHFVDNNTSLTSIAVTPNHRQAQDDDVYNNRHQQQQQMWNTGYSPAPSQINNNNNKTIPPLAPQQQPQNSNLVNLMMTMGSQKPSSSPNAQQFPLVLLLLEELELSARRNLGEHEESQRFTLRHSLMVTTTVMRLMTGTATMPQLPKRRFGDVGEMLTTANDHHSNADQTREEVTVRVPLSVIQEQQVALNQLLSQQSNNSGTPVNHNNNNNNNNQKNGHYYYSFAAASSSQQNQQVPDITNNNNNTHYRNDNSISVPQQPAWNQTTSSAVKPSNVVTTTKRSNSPSARNAIANQTPISNARTSSGKHAPRQQQQQPAASLHPCTKQEVVEFMRQILQPSYNAGLLPAEQFAQIVRDASSALFSIPPSDIDRRGYIMAANGNDGDAPLHWKDFIRERIAGFFS